MPDLSGQLGQPPKERSLQKSVRGRTEYHHDTDQGEHEVEYALRALVVHDPGDAHLEDGGRLTEHVFERGEAPDHPGAERHDERFCIRVRRRGRLPYLRGKVVRRKRKKVQRDSGLALEFGHQSLIKPSAHDEGSTDRTPAPGGEYRLRIDEHRTFGEHEYARESAIYARVPHKRAFRDQIPAEPRGQRSGLRSVWIEASAQDDRAIVLCDDGQIDVVPSEERVTEIGIYVGLVLVLEEGCGVVPRGIAVDDGAEIRQLLIHGSLHSGHLLLHLRGLHAGEPAHEDDLRDQIDRRHGGDQGGSDDHVGLQAQRHVDSKEERPMTDASLKAISASDNCHLRLAQAYVRAIMAGMSTYEDIRLEGHIIDSLLLPRVLDDILERGGEYRILRFRMGREKDDHSLAVLRVTAPSRGAARRHPARPAAARGGDRRTERRPAGTGALRRRVPRGLLFHHQSGDLRAPRRALDTGAVAGDGLRHHGRCRRGHGPDRALDPGPGRRPDRRRDSRHPRGAAWARPRLPGVRVHGLGGVVGEAQAPGGGQGGPAHARDPRRRQEDRRRPGAGGGPHRGRPGLRPAGGRRLDRRGLWRQRRRGARHRVGLLQHLTGHQPGRGRVGRGRPRAPPARDQPHPPLRRHPPGGGAGRADLRPLLRDRPAAASPTCWPAPSATTAPCPT